MPETITSILRGLSANRSGQGFTFVDSQGQESKFSFSRIAELAEHRGRQFLAAGLRPKDRAAVIIGDNEEFVLSFLGCVAVNIIPIPIYPPPPMGKKERQLQAALEIMHVGDVKGLISTEEIIHLLEAIRTTGPELPRRLIISELLGIEPSQEILSLPQPEDTCFIQFTSGSTSLPKGVIVSHQSLVANTHAIVHDGLRAHPDRDRGVSWLPLYHDMGLIGFVLAPIVGRIPVVLLPTFSFVRRPGLWMKAVHKYRATISFGPNFAFALATKRAKKVVKGDMDLSCLRVLGCGAEPISPSVMRDFSDAYAEHGFNSSSLTPSYGMAEACLAISFEPLDEALFTIHIDKEVLQAEGRVERVDSTNESAQEIVACGHSIEGHNIEIRSESGERLGEDQLGEVVFSGPSVTHAYFENAEATAQSSREGKLYTPDLVFFHQARLFICGRKKDLIILNGKNYHPEILEWVVESNAEIRQGSAVCFSVSGQNTEKLIVIAETADTRNEELRTRIRADLSREFGLRTEKISFVKPGQLPKTSSGKRQRQKTKALYEARNWSS